MNKYQLECPPTVDIFYRGQKVGIAYNHEPHGYSNQLDPEHKDVIDMGKITVSLLRTGNSFTGIEFTDAEIDDSGTQ
ncbi:hypothetical protein BH10ACI2_BH10ACI2_00450 [soil metagenome]